MGDYMGSKGANRQRAVQRVGAWNANGMMTPGGGLATATGAPAGAAAVGALGGIAGGGASGGAAAGGASPQMLAQVLRRMGGGAGAGSSGQGGFSMGQQTDMNSLPGGPSSMGAQGPAQSGAMRPAPWQGMNQQMYPPTPEAGGASGFAGGGGTMWAGGSPTFNENSGGFVGSGLPGASGGGMSPGMGAVPRTAGGMAFAPNAGMTGQQQVDPWQDFLSQYSQQ